MTGSTRPTESIPAPPITASSSEPPRGNSSAVTPIIVGPPERLADPENGRGGQGGQGARGRVEIPEPVQAERRERRAADERAERRLVRDRASPHANHEHQSGGVDEKQHAASASGFSCGTNSPMTRGNH